MHRRYQSLLAFAAIVLSFASGPAWTADFTFTVPVEVSNLPPDSRRGRVDCGLHINLRPGTRPAPVGGGQSMFAISAGAYRGEVTVAVNANSGIDPATVTHYTCGLAFIATVRGRDKSFSYNLNDTPPTLPVAPGAQNPRVDGTIR